MRHIILLLLASTVMFFTACGGGGGDTSSDNQQIVVKLSSCKPIYRYNLYDSDEICTYDNTGNVITINSKRIFPTEQGIVNISERETNYSYDFDKYEVMDTEYYPYEGYLIFTFNDDGIIVKYRTDGTNAEFIHIYDENNKIIQTISNYEFIDFTMNTVSTYKYNEDGQLIEWSIDNDIIYIGDANATFSIILPNSEITKYTYYQNGNIESLEATLSFSPDEAPSYVNKYTNSYDENSDGRVLVNHSEYGEDNSTSDALLEYDLEGNLVTYTYTKTLSDGSWTRHTSTYDENGILVNEVIDKG